MHGFAWFVIALSGATADYCYIFCVYSQLAHYLNDNMKLDQQIHYLTFRGATCKQKYVLFLFTALLLSALLHLCGSRTTSTFTPSQPVCPGERVQFNCTVVDDGQPIHGYTFWRVNNSAVKEICFLSHFLRRDMDQCDPFIAQLHGSQSNCYFSTLTANARVDLNTSLVQCFGPNENDLVGSDTLQIVG